MNGSGKYLIGTGSSSDGKVTFESAFKEAPIPRFFRIESWNIKENYRMYNPSGLGLSCYVEIELRLAHIQVLRESQTINSVFSFSKIPMIYIAYTEWAW